MLLLFEFIINWMISLTYGTLIFLIINRFLGFRWKHLVIQFLAVIILVSCSNIVVYPEEVTGTIGFFLFFIVFMACCFRDELYLKLSAALIIFPVIAASNYITQDIGFLIWMHLFNSNMSPAASTILHSLTLALRIPFWYCVYICILKWTAPGSKMLTRKMWLILDMISLTSFISVITVIQKTTTLNSYTAYPTCAACILTSLGCCGLLTYMAKAARADIELQAYQYQQTYYKELEQNQQTVRKLRHDMKNHLNIIGTFLKEQQTKQAESYLQELNHEFAASAKIYCQNSIINAVLNSKEQLAKDTEINYQFQIDLEEIPAIRDIDLCSLFANTLDNAIEACRMIPRIKDRTLSVKVRCKNHFFSYQIKNAKAHEIRIENELIQTSKPNPERHGIGLQNVKSIVEKYNGDINIAYDSNSFCVTILFPL